MKIFIFREQVGKQEFRKFMSTLKNKSWIRFSHPLDKVYVEKLKVLNLEDKSEIIILPEEFDKGKYKIIAFYVSGEKFNIENPENSEFEYFCVCNEWYSNSGGYKLADENILEIKDLSDDEIGKSNDWLNERLKHNYIERSKNSIADQNEYNEILEFLESHKLYMEAARFILSINENWYKVYRDVETKCYDVTKYILEEYCPEHDIKLKNLKECLNDSSLECIINQILLLKPDSKINLNDYIQDIIGELTGGLNIPEEEVYPKFVEIEDGLIPFYEYRRLDHGDIKGIYFTNSEEYDENIEVEWGYCNLDRENMVDLGVHEQRVLGTFEKAREEFEKLIYKNKLKNIATYLKVFKDMDYIDDDDLFLNGSAFDRIYSCSSESDIKEKNVWDEDECNPDNQYFYRKGKVGNNSYIVCSYRHQDFDPDYNDDDTVYNESAFDYEFEVFLLPNGEGLKYEWDMIDEKYRVLWISLTGSLKNGCKCDYEKYVETNADAIDSFFDSLMTEEYRATLPARTQLEKSEMISDEYYKFAISFALSLLDEKSNEEI